jgi:hypothetical protein
MYRYLTKRSTGKVRELSVNRFRYVLELGIISVDLTEAIHD